MKKINKLIAGVASAAMIVTAFSACGSASSSGKKLDFITGMATGSVHLKTLQSITDEFEKANPGVEINLIPASQDFTNDIKVRLAAKNAPDLGTPTAGPVTVMLSSLSLYKTEVGLPR